MSTIRTHNDAIEYLATYYDADYLKIEGDGPEAVVVVDHHCPRCWGSGKFGPHHVQGGVCFACGGDGGNSTDRVPVKLYAQTDKRNRTARARRDEKNRERRAAIEARQLEGQRVWNDKQGNGRITFAELEDKRAAERDARNASKQYVGTVGKREDFEARVVFTTSWETPFGVTLMIALETDDGNKIVWRCTGDPQGLYKGVKARFRATVKSHDEYKGEPQAVVARVKVAAIIDDPETDAIRATIAAA